MAKKFEEFDAIAIAKQVIKNKNALTIQPVQLDNKPCTLEDLTQLALKLKSEIKADRKEALEINQILEICEESIQDLHGEIFNLLNRLGRLCDAVNFDITNCQESLFGNIYLIKALGTDRFKIGLTLREVSERLDELNSKQSPYPLELVHYIQVVDVIQTEKFLHSLFDANRVHGEWFVFGNLNKVIETMNGLNVQILENKE